MVHTLASTFKFHNSKLLSQAGKEVLIKSMIQTIPTCTMGCFKIPLGLCHDIEALIKKF